MSGGSPASDESYEDIPQATILRLCANNEWGQADSILRTLKKGAEEVNYTKEDGITSLMYSCRENKLVLVERLCEFGADINAIDQHGRSALHYAANYAKTDVVKCLLSRKADVAALDNTSGDTILHLAAQKKDIELAKLVYEHGASVNAQNFNRTALHVAAQYGNTSLVELLTDKVKADPLARTYDGSTLLHVAAESGHTETSMALLKKGVPLMMPNKSGAICLHSAAKQGHVAVVKALLFKGAFVDAKTKCKETPLHIASRIAGAEQCVDMLIRCGADVNNDMDSGETPLHLAVRYCHWAVCEELLRYVTVTKSRFDATILVNQATATLETPIHYCARAGNSDILLEVAKHIEPSKIQIALNKQARNGWSPLLVASKEGHLKVVEVLLQHHARVDVFDEHGKAALHLAAECGNLEVANMLLLHKAFVNAKSKIGLTPLHLAAQNGFNKLAKLLVEEHGAAVDALSLAKKTPMHMAAETGQKAVCATLLNMGADANALMR
ncbi:hypothetical protein EB796_004243 [Bugula neritina]|uniref:Uncharacterized protein n=1 Tax=Bugula neritina TaxID=10212 RepID=A0A7J7KFM1_BUGNE|nr:hypothetical protein EB796_004243 [Bugula neritina]